MSSVAQGFWRITIIGDLVAGSRVVLPFVLTALIIGGIVDTVVASFGLGSWFGDLPTNGGGAHRPPLPDHPNDAGPHCCPS